MNQNVVAKLAIVLGLLISVTGWAESKRYIVTFKKSQDFKAASLDIARARAAFQTGETMGEVSSAYQLLSQSSHILASLRNLELVIVESDREDMVAQMAKNPRIESVEAEIFFPAPKLAAATNPKLKPSEGCDISTPWGITAVKADKAWAVTKGGQSRVLILDTGITTEHPDLKSRFEKGRDFTGGNSIKDTIGHGTHVAGTIAADGTCLVGVAPEAKILAGKVCQEQGCGTAAIIAGIDWGVQEKVSVISMSLGGPMTTPSQQRAVERAEQAGVVVVAASGNDGTRRVSYPAAYPSVVAVGAVQQNGADFKRAEFSQYGPGLDIVAPGVAVVSSVPLGAGRVSNVSVDLGDGKSTRVNSTSFAGAPQVENPVVGQLVFAGLGKPEDFKNASVRGKFALIQRGEIAFKDKVLNAVAAGATGVVIFNNADGLARGTIGEEGSIHVPVAMIEKVVGEKAKSALGNGAIVSASIVTESSNYDSYDGTSMATPHVSGVVALIRSANPGLSPARVRDVLTQSATNIGSADEYGAGMLNAEEAVRRARLTGAINLAM